MESEQQFPERRVIRAWVSEWLELFGWRRMLSAWDEAVVPAWSANIGICEESCPMESFRGRQLLLDLGGEPPQPAMRRMRLASHMPGHLDGDGAQSTGAGRIFRR
jgi:hypothetical protein